MMGGQLEMSDLSRDEALFIDVLARVGRIAASPGSFIRANVVEQVVTHSGPLGSAFADFRRLVIGETHVVGKLDLSDTVAFPVLFRDCVFSDEEESFDVSRSEIRDLRLTGCSFAGTIRGENCRVSGNFLVINCVVEGSVNLLLATVGGTLIVDNCTVNGAQEPDVSLNFDGIQVQGLFKIVDSRFAGGLSIREARLISQSVISGTALGVDEERTGRLLLQKTMLGSELTIGPDVIASELKAEALRSESDLVLTAVRSYQGLITLDLDRIQLRGGLQVFQMVAGRLLLRGASVSMLKITETSLRAPGLNARGTSVPGSAGNDKYAISADGLRVANDVQLGPDLAAIGEVRLNGASIGGQVQHKRGNTQMGVALNLEEAQVASSVFLDDMDPRSFVQLAAATVGGIFINPDNLPHVSLLRTEYRFINNEEGKPPSVEVALDLLEKDLMAHSTVPYRRLARWFAEEQGDSDTANAILIAGEQKTNSGRSYFPQFVDSLWRLTVGYGYLPGRAVWPFVGLLAAATFVFASVSGFSVPVDWNAYPAILPVGATQEVFNPFLYALSATVPFLPSFLSPWAPSNPQMQLLTVIFQILGWLLITSLVAGLANRLRRKD
jgi:hypothetical protein